MMLLEESQSSCHLLFLFTLSNLLSYSFTISFVVKAVQDPCHTFWPSQNLKKGSTVLWANEFCVQKWTCSCIGVVVGTAGKALAVGMPCLGHSSNCTVGQGGQLQAYRFSELPRGFCRWGVRREKHELPLPEGCCRDPGLCTDMLASELPALLSSLQKLVVFELESLEKAWLPDNVVSVKWKREKKKKKRIFYTNK